MTKKSGHYHCDINVGVKDAVGGKLRASSHFSYLSRTGIFEKLKSSEELVHVSSGNLPSWASADASLFWLASDTFERQNGSVYRELEGALPRELSHAQQLAIVDKFIATVLANHPYTAGIHIKPASDGAPQPHVHLMWSEREMDGIDRPSDVFFKRVAAGRKDKNGNVRVPDPATGGCRKESMQPRLMEFRELWATLINEAYVEAGLDIRVDHRSLVDQGIDRAPERHLGPVRMKGEEGVFLLARREAEREFELATVAALTEIDEAAIVEKRQKRLNQLFAQSAPRPKKKVVDVDLAEPSSILSPRSRPRREVKKRAFDPDRARWLSYRLQIQDEQYGQSSTWLATFWRVERVKPSRDVGFVFKNSNGEVTDKGPIIVAKSGNSDEIDAILELASLKNWTSIEFSGPDDFKIAAMIAALKDGKLRVSATTDADRVLLRHAKSIVGGGAGAGPIKPVSQKDP